MNEAEIHAKAKQIRSIPFALRVAGLGILLSLIPLGLAFNEYRAANPEVALTGNFIDKLVKVLEFHMDPTKDAVWMKVFLVSLPLGLLVVVFGLFQSILRYLIPLVLGLTIALGLLCAHIFLCWQHPDFLPPPQNVEGEWSTKGVVWVVINTVIGSLAFLVGALLTLKDSVLVKTFLNLIIGTAFSLLITISYPFILLGGAFFLKKKRGLSYTRIFSESGNLYNFLILNIYPIFFQILPGLGLVKKNAKLEAKAHKKKYKNGEVPKYTSSLDFNKLKFGDVILTGRPSWGKSGAIQAANLLSCGEDSRYWSHAVIYAGHPPGGDTERYNIIEAQSNGKGVQEIDLITGEKVIYETDPVLDENGNPSKDENGRVKRIPRKNENGKFIVKKLPKDKKQRLNYTEKNGKKIKRTYTPEEIEDLSFEDQECLFEKSYFEEGFYLMVLRPKYADRETLEKVVNFCRERDGEGCGYDTWGVSFYSLCALVPPMLSGWLEEKIANDIFNVDNAYFCSELLADAFRYGGGQEIFDRSSWRVKPLDFRLNPLFEEVDCGYERRPANEAAKKERADTIKAITDLEQKVKEYKDNFKPEAQFKSVKEKLKKAREAVEQYQYPYSEAKKLYVNPSMAWGTSSQAPASTPPEAETTELESRESKTPEPAPHKAKTPEPDPPEEKSPGPASPEEKTPETASTDATSPEDTTPETKSSELPSTVKASDVKFPKMEFPKLKTAKTNTLGKKENEKSLAKDI